jgi:hypothetical protein
MRRRRRRRSEPVGLTLYYALMLWASSLRRAGNAESAKGGLAPRADLAPRDVASTTKAETVAPNPDIVQARSKVRSAVIEAPTRQEGRNYLLRRARGKKGGR